MRALLLLLWLAFAAAAQDFLVKPYLQLGNSTPVQLEVLWHAADAEQPWTVEAQTDRQWRQVKTAVARRVVSRRVEPHRVWSAKLPGPAAAYRVLWNGKTVFESRIQTSRRRFIVTGDTGSNTPAQRALAFQMHRLEPSLVAIAGDIVYEEGRIPQYRRKFFPIYNADQAAEATGAPLMRAIPFAAAPGNHDVYSANLSRGAGGLAYYLYWAQPLNGPAGSATPLSGSALDRKAFQDAAGQQYPRMASFSFDYGGAHWVVLDSNKYAAWSRPEMVEWLRRDLAAAQSAPWRFVLYHHPSFSSARKHFDDQWMRALAPVFEQGRVHIVFTAHVHNYQRSHPQGGVTYLVTGAGGDNLYNRSQHNKPRTWQPYTAKFLSRVHSVTVVDAEDAKLTVRQIDTSGSEVDRFEIAR